MRRNRVRDMKVLTFYTVRGGSGKTVLSAAFASYIRYTLGLRVLVLDFDGPEYNLYNMRARELDYMRGNGIKFDADDLYIVDKVENREIDSLEALSANLNYLKNEFDFVVMDFPGSFADGDAVCQLAMDGVIDLVVIPVELDAINISSSKSLALLFQENGQMTLPFFNRVHGKENPELYERLRMWFGKHGVRVSENIVKNSLSMKKEMGVKGFLRSTVCFPEKDIREKNPGIINLFEEIVGYEENEDFQKTKDSGQEKS